MSKDTIQTRQIVIKYSGAEDSAETESRFPEW